MLSVLRPNFEVVKEGRILLDYLPFLLLYKVFGDRTYFDKPNPKTPPEGTRISLVTPSKLKD
jgi:hypothetical protein